MATGPSDGHDLGAIRPYLDALLELAAVADPHVRHPSAAEIRARALSFAHDLGGRSERMGWVLRSRVGRDAIGLAQNLADLLAILDSTALDRLAGNDIIDRWKAFLDDVAHPAALIDSTGEVIHVNRSWQAFAEGNGGDAAHVSLGMNYLDVCDDAARAGEHDGAVVARALRDLLDSGRMGVPVTWVYPCHSPKEFRWFQLTAFPLPARRGAAIIHINLEAGQPALTG